MLNEMNQNQNRQAVRYLFPDKKNHSNYQKINKKTEPPSQKREIKPRRLQNQQRIKKSNLLNSTIQESYRQVTDMTLAC